MANLKPKAKPIAAAKPHKDKPPKDKRTLAPYKLTLLITVVPRNKAEFYLDLLQSFEVNLQMSVSAHGTANKLSGLLASEDDRQVLFSIIRQDNVKAALTTLENKFATIREGKGVAFTVPLSSTVGVAVYRFLSNRQE